MIDVVAGVDIGGTNTVFGLVDREGNIIAESRLDTASYPEFVKAMLLYLVLPPLPGMNF